MQGIYRIRNILDDKRYVGSTNDFEKGWKTRQWSLRRGDFYNPRLQNAWNKYSEENFAFEIEEKVIGDNKALLAVEQVYLDKGFELGNLYNITRKAGGGNLGEEANRKKSKSLTGKPKSEEHKAKLGKAKLGENNPNYGKDHSGENNPHFGIPHTEVTKIKMSKSHIGHEVTEETRAKISAGNAKAYPAFYNIKTEEFIKAGRNLWEMCQDRNLSYFPLWYLKQGNTKQSRDGWRLAKEEEDAVS